MKKSSNPYKALSHKTLFLVWGPPSVGPRSAVFARELGIEALHFVYLTDRRGVLIASFKYAYQAIQTLQLLFHERPKIVFVQSPPSLAVLFVYLYCALTNSHYVIDAHSGALLYPFWVRPKWLHAFLARKAVTTIVTNEHFQEIVQSWGGAAIIIRDIPTNFEKSSPPSRNGNFNVVVVNTFSTDEPIEGVLEAADAIPDVQFYITGKKSRANPGILSRAPLNVQFTDFLPNEEYYALLDSSDAVMCLTTQDHTMQRGACEALSLGKPIITSDWPLLRDYFCKGTVHVPNTSQGIRDGVVEMKNQYDHFKKGILELQESQRREWIEKVTALTRLAEKAIDR